MRACPVARWQATEMVLQLDPRFVLLWRDPTSLQFGLDSPRAVLDDVSNAEERMIAALVIGISRPGLTLIARGAGSDDTAVEHLLRRVAPALRPQLNTRWPAAKSPEKRHRGDSLAAGNGPASGDSRAAVTVTGSGPTVDAMATTLAASGLKVRLVGEDVNAAAQAADVAVIVAQFVVNPEFYGLWLRRDRPHLPVVFGDTGAQIGPFVEPGVTACLYCMFRTKADTDPAWPALACQLWGTRSAADRGLVAAEAAVIATRLVLERVTRATPGPATAVWLDAASGATRAVPCRPHPECGCAVLPENGKVAASLSVAVPSPPRTAATADAPG